MGILTFFAFTWAVIFSLVGWGLGRKLALSAAVLAAGIWLMLEIGNLFKGMAERRNRP